MPAVIGGFQVVEPIAKGGMAMVYKGRDRSGNLEVAIKLVTKEHSDAYDRRDRKNRKNWDGYKYLKGITWDGEILMNLNHPHIVHSYEIGKEGGQYYIVMEYMPSRSLHELSYNRSKRLRGRRLKVVYQFGHALMHVHRAGIIHRDVCPRNVLLGEDDRAKLIDFGLAIPKLDKLKDVFYRSGTPSYMSPEVVRSGHYDYQSDIYAFGVSMYEIFTGKPPFSGGDEFDRAVRNLNSPVIPPREVNANVPPELDRIVLKAMEKDPRKRYESMDNVVQELGRIVRSTASESTRILIEDDTRRMHERIRERCYLHYYLKTWVSRGPKEVAVTDNISVGGVSFCVRQAPEIGANLQMEIQPRAAATRIQATGKVVRVGEKDSTGLTSIGVEFSKIAPRDQERFQKYIQQRKTVDAPITESTNYGN